MEKMQIEPITKPTYEHLSARKYYRKGRVGSVILSNGVPIFHGNPIDAKKLSNKLTQVSYFLDFSKTPKSQMPHFQQFVKNRSTG